MISKLFVFTSKITYDIFYHLIFDERVFVLEEVKYVFLEMCPNQENIKTKAIPVY